MREGGGRDRGREGERVEGEGGWREGGRERGWRVREGEGGWREGYYNTIMYTGMGQLSS